MPAPSSSIGEGLERDHRLRRRVDYLRCYRRGRKRHGDLATLHFHPNEHAFARLGITASRKVGKAVVRQRAKRRVREIFRRWPQRDDLATLDLVVHLKPTIATAAFADIEFELHRLFNAAIAWRQKQATAPTTLPATQSEQRPARSRERSR